MTSLFLTLHEACEACEGSTQSSSDPSFYTVSVNKLMMSMAEQCVQHMLLAMDDEKIEALEADPAVKSAFDKYKTCISGERLILFLVVALCVDRFVWMCGCGCQRVWVCELVHPCVLVWIRGEDNSFEEALEGSNIIHLET